ncbi:HpcH/HpaI aldolase/citrate lyase family protein [Lachnospiraceae bacterium YSD2013]|nr:HpcH/HpaI aldolase/citrate lyase family protein [Lachnospiraceae bacterium YSD2013]
MPLKLMYITNNENIALIAEKYGVDRIWIDLETLGKEKRQKNYDSVKSHHSIEDLSKIRPLLTTSDLMVRVNPWNEQSEEEIEAVIEAGAQIVMLPMWTCPDEVEKFIRAVDGRAKTNLLLETVGAENCLDEVLKLQGIDEIHIGLNDLHIQYKLKFMFELLANGTVDRICNKIKDAGIPYGFGGVARIGCGDVPAELVISEHYRLGSTIAILSRSFCDVTKYSDYADIDRIFEAEMKKIRDCEAKAISYSNSQFLENRNAFVKTVEKVVARRIEE